MKRINVFFGVGLPLLLLSCNGKQTLADVAEEDSLCIDTVATLDDVMLSDTLAEELASKAVQGIDERFAARRPKGGKMPVVMGAGASGILLHEAMGHAFEADFNRKGQSVFSDKMGRKICPDGITVVDDATIRGNRGALNFDDEGVPGQRTVLVEDGVLVKI